MGEKAKKLDIHCPYCGRKHNYEDLLDRLYVDEMTTGDIAITCPKCEGQFIKEDK